MFNKVRAFGRGYSTPASLTPTSFAFPFYHLSARDKIELIRNLPPLHVRGALVFPIQPNVFQTTQAGLRGVPRRGGAQPAVAVSK
jgi:hypothetical protein